MGRKRRKPSSEQGPGQVPGTSTQVQLAASMGIPNLGRAFKLSQTFNTPQICIHAQGHAFKGAWSEGVIDDQDCTAAHTIVADPSVDLYPITPIAHAFVDRHWPLLLSLLQSGTGSRWPADMAQVVRYFATTIDVLEDLLFPLQLNYLVNGMPWSEIPPGDSTIPPAVWSLAELFDAGDIGVADVWKPIYDRVRTKVLPPRLTAQVFETMFPYVNHYSGHCINLHASRAAVDAIETWAIGDYIVNVLNKLDYLEDELIQCHNTLASFLPWVVGTPMAMFKGYDPLYEEVDYNGTLAEYSPFGDSSDPGESTAIVCGTAANNGDAITYFHKGDAPLVKAVLNTPIWEVISDTDDKFMCITHAFGGNRILVDDDLNRVLYTAGAITSTDAQRYRRYVPNRFNYTVGASNLEYGISKAGFSSAVIAKEEIVRLSQRYASYLFGDDQLARVLQYTGGASVRTIREAVLALWQG